VQTFAEGLSLFGLKFNESMRNAIFVEEIIKLMSFPCPGCCENTQPCKFPVPSQSFSAHDQCFYDRLAHSGQFGECATEFSRGHVEYLRLFRRYPGRRKDRRALEHRDIASEIALARGGENLFDAIALLERLEFAAQDDSQTDVALPCFEDELTAF
jgi:hypothetical protein